MLSVDNAIPALLDLGLLSNHDIVFGAVFVRTEARRNRNLRVQRRGQRGYLIKQPEDATAKTSLRAEAGFYGLCATNKDYARVLELLPRVAYLDQVSNTVYLELLEPAHNLWPLYRDADHSENSLRAAHSLGVALATVHETFRVRSVGRYLSRLSNQTPWILQVHRPNPALMATISAANYQTLSIIQGERALCRSLDDLSAMWQSSTVIHGDIKSDNVLWIKEEQSSGGAIRIVDWEMVQRGDPAWDVAGYFQDVLLFWLTSLPSADSVEEMVDRCARPLRMLHPLFRSFWRAYRGTMGAAHHSAELLSRAVKYTGGRLIQSAYEMSTHVSVLPLRAVLSLQLSANLLDDPESAQVQLMGLFDDF